MFLIFLDALKSFGPEANIENVLIFYRKIQTTKLIIVDLILHTNSRFIFLALLLLGKKAFFFCYFTSKIIVC